MSEHSGTRQGAPVAAITGAGSGIGRATAVALAQQGWRLVIMGRTRERLTDTASHCPTDVEVVGGDAGGAAQCAHLVARAVERFGRLDALVNNAGAAPLASIDQSTPDLIDAAFRINALAPAYAIHAAWPVFVRQQSGCIVNVSTLGTLDPFPGFFAYAAAKASVNLMARSCAIEGRRYNIRAFAVAPGAVETDMLRANFSDKALPASRCLQPAQVARVIVECILGKRDDDIGNVIYLRSPDDVPMA